VSGQAAPWEDLDAPERGFVLGALMLGATGGAAERLAGPAHERCAATLRALAVLDRPARARVLAGLAREATDPVPPGMAKLHPSWFEEVLADEPSELVLALTAACALAGLAQAGRDVIAARGEDPNSCRAAVLASGRIADLQRIAFAPLRALVEARCGPLGERLCALAERDRVQEIVRLGTRALRAQLLAEGIGSLVTVQGVGFTRDGAGWPRRAA
jgi:hypothetical protein